MNCKNFRVRDVWLFAFNLIKLLLCIDKETERASAHHLENQQPWRGTTTLPSRVSVQELSTEALRGKCLLLQLHRKSTSAPSAGGSGAGADNSSPLLYCFVYPSLGEEKWLCWLVQVQHPTGPLHWRDSKAQCPPLLPLLSQASNSRNRMCIRNHLGIVLKYSFWFSRFGVAPDVLHLSQAPRWCLVSAVAGPCITRP